jgi:hypothetical protein
VKADQFAAAEHALRLLGRARDAGLHQHLAGKAVAGLKLSHCQREVSIIAHHPDAAARGADGGLDHAGKTDSGAERIGAGDDLRLGLRQSKLTEHAAEAGLAMRRPVACEGRQGQAGQRPQPLLHPGEQEALFVDRQQHVIVACRQQAFDEPQEAQGIFPHSRAAVIYADKSREPRQPGSGGIADIHHMAGEAEHGDSLPRGGAGAFRQQYPQRLKIRAARHHAQSCRIPGPWSRFPLLPCTGRNTCMSQR